MGQQVPHGHPGGADRRVEVDDTLLDDAFDLRRSLSNLDVIFEQLDAIER